MVPISLWQLVKGSQKYNRQQMRERPDDEDDTRSSLEYLNDLEEEYQARTLLAKTGHFTRDCFEKTSVFSYQSPFHSKQVSSSMYKPELRPTKDFEAKYNKVKAKVSLLSSSASPSKSTMVKNKVKVLMELAEDNDAVSEEGARNGEWVKISMIKLSKAERFILPNHDTGRILPPDSQTNSTEPLFVVIDSSVTDYDSANESSVCSIPLPPLEKLGAPAKINKKASASKINSAPTGKLKHVKTEDDFPFYDHNTHEHNKLSLKEEESSPETLNISLRAWYETLLTYLTEHKFVRDKIDNTLFVYKTQTDVILVQIYVDDIIFGSTSINLCKQFAKLMTQRYEMSMMGVLTYFLGFQIKQSERGILINQEIYVKDLLKKYDINGSSVKTLMVSPNNLGPNLNGKSVNETHFRGMIGSLMYLTASRPDIQFSTCLCARYQANPKESHLIVVKRIFRYLKGTLCLGLWYPKCSGFDLKGYPTLTMLDATWTEKEPQVPIFCDNTSAIAISNNPVLHSRTKHIDIRYHFIRDHILKGDIELHFIPTQYQLVDIFTKPLDEPTFKRLIVKLGMLNIDSKPEPSALTEENLRVETGVTTFRNAIGAHYSDGYVDSPSLAIVKPWFVEIGYNGEIKLKGTLKKSCLTPRWRLLIVQIIQCLGDVPYVPKAPKPSSQTEKKQATGVPTSLGVTSEEGAHPQSVVVCLYLQILNLFFLASYIFHSESASGNDASANFTAKADPKISAPDDSVPHQQGPDEGSKNYTPNHTFACINPSVLIDKTKSTGEGSQTAHIVSGTKVDTTSAYMDDEDEPFIASEERNKEHAERNKDTHVEPKRTSFPPTSPTSVQIQELQAQILLLKSKNQKLEHDKEKAVVEIATFKPYSSILIELKELPTKITTLSEEVNELKKHIKDFEVELPETLEALPGLLNKVTDTLNKFASILNAHNKGVPLASKSTASPIEGEKNTNPVTEDVELANLVDLMGINVVEEYNKKKLLYNNDLHLAEWREVIQACPDKSEKRMENHLWYGKDKIGSADSN
ncbi:retrovirus-related pol polyprotein from transposon TNT 1-94 [Tanacetum coccineum]